MSEQFREQPEKTPENQISSEGIINEYPKDEKYEARRQRSIEAADENTKTFMEWAEEQGYDWNDETFMRIMGKKFLGDMNELFGKEYGLSVITEDLPEVAVHDKSHASFAKCMLKDGEEERPLDVIFVGRINEILNGNTIGEELAHFYRCHFEPQSEEEAITSEFFGFLGKRLWEKASQKELGSLDLLKSDAEHVIESKKDFLKAKRAMKQTTNFYIQEIKKSGDDTNNDNDDVKKFYQEMAKEIEKTAKESRKDAIAHQRGYEMALKIDMDKITNWKKFFSMPNKEVRKRFFTDKPDYSGL